MSDQNDTKAIEIPKVNVEGKVFEYQTRLFVCYDPDKNIIIDITPGSIYYGTVRNNLVNDNGLLPGSTPRGSLDINRLGYLVDPKHVEILRNDPSKVKAVLEENKIEGINDLPPYELIPDHCKEEPAKLIAKIGYPHTVAGVNLRFVCDELLVNTGNLYHPQPTSIFLRDFGFLTRVHNEPIKPIIEQPEDDQTQPMKVIGYSIIGKAFLSEFLRDEEVDELATRIKAPKSEVRSLRNLEILLGSNFNRR